MADLVLNTAAGSFAHHCGLPLTNDALIAAWFNMSGLAADSAFRDYDTLAAVAGGSTEHAQLSRKTLTGVVVTTDDTNDRKYVDADDITHTAVAASAQAGGMVVAYDDDTTGGTDSNIVPFFKYDVDVTPAGGDISWQVNAGGLARATPA